MKRMIALLLAIFMVLGMVPTTALAAETDFAISFSTNFAETMTVGDTFTVTADLANNPGIAAMTLSLQWNDAVVKFTGYEKYEDDFPVSEVLEARGWTVTPNHELGILVAFRTTNNSDNGTLFTANFEIVGYGDAGIGLKQANLTEYELRDENSVILEPVLDFSALEGLTVSAPEAPAPVNPHTGAISSTLTDKITVDGSTVTLKYTGLTPEDGYAPFTITVPEGVDPAVALLKNSAGTVAALNAKNLVDGSRVVKYVLSSGNTPTYQVDWDGDGTFDLTINLDVTALHTAHEYGEATCVKAPTCTYYGCGATEGEPDPEAHNYSEETGECTNDGCDAVKPGFNDAVVYEGEIALNGTADITITELILKDAREKVLASYMGEYAGSWPMNIFLDGDKAKVGDVFEFDFTAGGDDKDLAGFRIIPNYMGNTFTIASDGYAMGTMQIQDTNGTTSVVIRPNLWLVNNFGLNNTELTVAEGKEATLSVTTSIGDVTSSLKPYVEWESSNTEVATVSGGKVTAVGKGTATITATVGTKSASCSVTVECDHDWANKDGVCAKTDCGYECTHDWKDATCVAPKTCAICSLTEGDVSTEHNYGEDGKCTVDGCDEVDPRADDVTVWTGELKSKYSNLDLYVSEWYIEDGKDFVLGSVTTYEYLPGGNVTTSTFVDAGQIEIGDQVKLGAVVSGDDAETNLKAITSNVGTIQDYNYFTQQMRVEPTDYNAITNTFSVYRVGTLALADVTMLDTETADLTLTDSDNILTNDWAVKYLGNLVEWTSSDESVVKVVAEQRELYGNKYMVGKLVPQGPGTATITAKVGTDAISKTATCIVTVECDHDYINGICDKCSAPNPDYIAISEITLSSNTDTVPLTDENGEPVLDSEGNQVKALPMTVGGSEKLVATLNAGANQGITWTTSDPDVATVEDGVITAVGEGTATITATAGGRDVITTFAVLLADAEEQTPVSASFVVTVTAAPESGYTVTMPADQKVAANTPITVPVTLGHADGTTKYNSFDITLSYPAGLTLTSTEIDGVEVTTGEGTVRVKGYGDAKDAGTAPFSLTFEASAIGTYAVEITAAKVDSSNGAVNGNAPDAGFIDKVTYITVSGYDVTLPEGFTGDSTTAPGQDYSFTIPDDNYNYDVTIKVGETELTEEDYTVVGNTYTISKDKINGAIEVTAKSEPKTFKVTFQNAVEGDTANHFPEAAGTATYGTNYVATLAYQFNYQYSLSMTINGVTYTGYTMSDSTLTIPGLDITGDIEITVTATYNSEGSGNTDGTRMHNITFDGATGVAPSATASIIDGGTYTFSLNADAMEAGYTYTVQYNGEALTPDNNGQYSVGPVKTNIIITITKTLSAETTVEVSDYVTKSTGTVKLVKVTGALSDGKVFAYDGKAMFYVEQYEAWAYLDLATGTDAFTADTAKAKISTVAGTKEAQTIAAGYDVNKSGTVDINDAQLAYDIYKADMYTDVTAEDAAVSVEKFLRADVNNTGSVDTSDAAAVVSQIQ